MILLTSGTAYAQLITVLLIFVAVLGVTAWVTKWLANYQKVQGASRSIEVIETAQLVGGPNAKWIQIVRIGDTYKAIAVAKDQVTYLGDIDPETLRTEMPAQGASSSFAALFSRAMKKAKGESEKGALPKPEDTDVQ